MTLKFPVPVADFASYVPHRPPMVWVNEVLRATPQGGECRVVLDRKALYFFDGRLSLSSCIEWVAQSFAFVRTGYLLQLGHGLEHRAEQAFLVGIRKAELLIDLDSDEEMRAATELIVAVKNFREFGPILMFEGEIRLPSGRMVMRGNLRVYHGVPEAAH